MESVIQLLVIYLINECATEADRFDALQADVNACNIREVGNALIDGNLMVELVEELVEKHAILDS